MLYREAEPDARLPVLRLVATRAPPELPLAPHHHWHLFLSHVWRTAQDSCNAIKRNLQLLLPGVSVFLDTDDIGGAVGDLEKHVDAAAVVNIFVSKGYFMSKNCLREAIQTVRKGKPLTLVFDPVWGAQEFSLSDEIRSAVVTSSVPADLLGERRRQRRLRVSARKWRNHSRMTMRAAQSTRQ